MTINREKKLLIGLAVATSVLLIKLFVIQIVNDKYKEDASNLSLIHI